MNDACKTCVTQGAYVKKGEIIYRITRQVNDANNIIEIVSPYSGYVLPINMWDRGLNRILGRDGIENDDEIMLFYETENQLYFGYKLDFDAITNSKIINWRSKESIFDFNIKANQPCLHLQYKDFHISRNDRVVFFDGHNNLILSLVAVKSEHRYKEGKYEVDFILSYEDIHALINNEVSELRIIYDNDDYPTIITCDTKKLKLYLDSYCEALDKADISYDVMSKDLTGNSEYDYCYVYLMHDKRNGYHKIGISKTPEYREKTLQSEQPNIEMVCSKRYPTRKIARAFESALHEAYAEQRVRGEWFNLSEIDIEMLKESLS